MSKKRRRKTKPQIAKKATSTSISTAPSRWRLWVFRLVAVIGVPALFLVLVESGLRIADYGTPTSFTIDSEIKGKPVRVDNRRFSWQFFPRRIARPSEPLVIAKDKPANTYRIFVLGASAAKGDPDAAFSFGRILEFMLKDKYPGVRFEVYNTAITAINSHVVLEIARDCAQWDSDLFIVYLGNNEVVGPFGAGTVFAPMASSLFTIRAATRVGQLRIGQLLKNVMRLAGQEEEGPKTWQGIEMFLDNQVRHDDPGMETVYSHFRDNLEELCGIAQETGTPMILSNVGVNLRDCAPLASLHRTELTAGDQKAWGTHHQAGIRYETAQKFADAIEKYLEAERIDNQYADLHYRLGKAYWKTGNFEEARKRFARALELDTLRFRADRQINLIIEETAMAEGAANGVHFVDAIKALEANSPHNTPGRELFFEHVHLNFSGNYILAKTVFSKVAELLQPWIRKKEDTQRDLLTEAGSIDRMVYTTYDRYHSESDMLSRIQQPPFSNRLDNQKQQEHIQNKVELLTLYTEPEERGRSMAQYQHAVREDPLDWRFHYNFARLLDAYDQQEERVRELTSLLSNVPHYPLAWMQRGDALSELEDYREAITSYEMALQQQPDNTAAHVDIGIAYEGLGNLLAAREHFDIAIEDNPHDFPLFVKLAQHKSSLGKYEDALGYYRQALRIDSRAGDVIDNMALVYFKLGQFEKAAAHYREALEFVSDQSGTYNNLGNVFVSMGQQEESIENFSKALQLSPENALIRANLANAQTRQGQFSEAVANYEVILEANPTNTDARFGLASALMEMSLFREAAEHLTLILEKDPEHPGLESTLGLALARNGENQKAIPFFLKAIEKEPDHSSLYLNLGNTYLGIGQVEKAVEEYEKVLHYDPENLQVHHNLAYSYLELEDWENAISHFHKYLQINPDDARARDQLAMALRKSGKK